MEFDLTNAARAILSACEAVDVERGTVLLEFLGVPALMNALIDGPYVSEVYTIIGALENKVSNERSLVDELVDKEFDLIQNGDVVFLVLDLEVAFVAGVLQVDHVSTIDQLSELSVTSGTRPGAVVDHALNNDLESGSRVGSGEVRKSASCLRIVRGISVDHAGVSTDFNTVSSAAREGSSEAVSRNSVRTSTLERAGEVRAARANIQSVGDSHINLSGNELDFSLTDGDQSSAGGGWRKVKGRNSSFVRKRHTFVKGSGDRSSVSNNS
jgi:hypothetical protein